MSDLSSAVNSSLDSVSGTVDLVANAARSGAADARAAATKVLSNTGVFLSRVVYGATYTISYGVVFPVALVAGSIPRNNAAVRGLIEGGAGGEPPGRCDPRPLSVSAGLALNTEAPPQWPATRSFRGDATPSLLRIAILTMVKEPQPSISLSLFVFES